MTAGPSGFSERSSSWDRITRSAAVLVTAVPALLANTARIFQPFSALVAGRCAEGESAPASGDHLEPSREYCQATDGDGSALAMAEKTATLPATTVREAGCSTTTGGRAMSACPLASWRTVTASLLLRPEPDTSRTKPSERPRPVAGMRNCA
jgi:hypothetical protein